MPLVPSYRLLEQMLQQTIARAPARQLRRPMVVAPFPEQPADVPLLPMPEREVVASEPLVTTLGERPDVYPEPSFGSRIGAKGVPPTITPPPALTPVEQSLRNWLFAPETMQQTMQMLMWQPEMVKDVLGIIQSIAPRAFPAVELQFRQQWEKEEQARLATQKQDIMIATDLLTDRIQAAITAGNIPALIGILEDARNLPPEQYQVVRTRAIAGLVGLGERIRPQMSQLIPYLTSSEWLMLHEGMERESQRHQNLVASATAFALAKVPSTLRTPELEEQIKTIAASTILPELVRASPQVQGSAFDDIARAVDGLVRNLINQRKEVIRNRMATLQPFITLAHSLLREPYRPPQHFAQLITSAMPWLTTFGTSPEIIAGLKNLATSMIEEGNIEAASTSMHQLASVLRQIADDPVFQERELVAMGATLQHLASLLDQRGAIYRQEGEEIRSAFVQLLDAVPSELAGTAALRERIAKLNQELQRERLKLEQARVNITQQHLALARDRLQAYVDIARERLEATERRFHILQTTTDVRTAINELTNLKKDQIALERLNISLVNLLGKIQDPRNLLPPEIQSELHGQLATIQSRVSQCLQDLETAISQISSRLERLRAIREEAIRGGAQPGGVAQPGRPPTRTGRPSTRTGRPPAARGPAPPALWGVTPGSITPAPAPTPAP